MSVQHTSLSGAECHDPKGIALTVRIADIGTANVQYVAVPKDFTKLVEVHVVLDAAITGADDTVTIKDHSDASTMATVTVANAGSAAGSIFSSTGITGQELSSGSVVRVENSGASTGPTEAVVTLYFERA